MELRKYFSKEKLPLIGFRLLRLSREIAYWAITIVVVSFIMRVYVLSEDKRGVSDCNSNECHIALNAKMAALQQLVIMRTADRHTASDAANDMQLMLLQIQNNHNEVNGRIENLRKNMEKQIADIRAEQRKAAKNVSSWN